MFCISPAQELSRWNSKRRQWRAYPSLPVPALLLAKAEQQQQRELNAQLDRVVREGVPAQQQRQQELARAQQQLADEQEPACSSASHMML